MIISFSDQGTEDIFNGLDSKAARKKLPSAMHRQAWRKLDWLNRARSLSDLKVPPGNHLEALKGSLAGCCSIRINDQFRIVFQWNGANALNVKVMDYH